MLKYIYGTADTKIDVNSRLTLFAAMLMSTIGGSVFIVQPGFVQGMVDYLGFSEKEVGYIASAEMSGFALMTILMIFLSSRVNWRKTVTIFLTIAVLGNFLSTGVDSVEKFALIRFFVGLGTGGLVSVSYSIVALSAKPDRNFGYMIVMAAVYGGIGFFAMPTLYKLAEMNGLLYFFAAFAAIGIAFVRYLPASGKEHIEVPKDVAEVSFVFKGMALAGMFTYFLAQGVIWAYLFLIGTSAGIGEQSVANSFTISQLAAIVGAMVAAIIGIRYGRSLPLTIGILGAVTALLFMFGATTALTFGMIVIVYNFLWNMTHPYLLATMASLDHTGKVVVLAVSMQTMGLAFGPALAALFVPEEGFRTVIWLGAGLFVIAFLLIIFPVLSQRKILKLQSNRK